MKRTIALCLSLMLLMVMFMTACNKPTSSTPPSTSSSTPASTPTSEPSSVVDPTLPYQVNAPVSIEFWSGTSAAARDTEAALVKKATDKNPNITVEIVYTSSILEKVIAATVAGGADLPGIAQQSSDETYQLATGELAEPLNARLEAYGVDVADYSKGLIEAFTWEGNIYQMPYLNSCCVWFYNKTAAAAENIKVPEKWDEMDAFMKAATKEGRAALGVLGSNAFYYECFFRNNGLKLVDCTNQTVDINSDLAKSMTKQLKSWVDAGQIMWYYGSSASTNMRAAFIDGSLFAITHSPGIYMTYYNNCDFDLGMIFQPGGSAARLSEAGGKGNYIPAKASDAKKNAGFQVMLELGDNAGNVELTRITGYLLLRKSVQESAEGKAFLAEHPEYANIMSNLDNVVPRPRGAGAETARDHWEDKMALIMVENADVDSTLDACAKEMVTMLKDAVA